MDVVTSSSGAPTFEEYAVGAWPSLYRYAYLLAGNHADAEDLAQQALLKAYGAWSKVAGADSPTAYLRRTLTNTYLSQKRPKASRSSLSSSRRSPRFGYWLRAAHPCGCGVSGSTSSVRSRCNGMLT